MVPIAGLGPDGEARAPRATWLTSERLPQVRGALLGLTVFAGLVVWIYHSIGTGSARDWAAKGTRLLGVRAIIAGSFERIHRSNLVNMGILPLQFRDAENAASLKLTGRETYAITGMCATLKPRCDITVTATAADGTVREFSVLARIDTPEELVAFRNGGILPYVLRQLARVRGASA